MKFSFRKLYADLVTNNGTVCVAYVAWLDAWGIASVFAGVELYWPDGRREVLHARPSTREMVRTILDGTDEGFDFSFDVPGGPLVIEFRARHGGWEPFGDPPCAGLSWRVVAARAEVRARWLGDATRPALHGIGYSDWVEIARPVRSLGLAALHWGRIHLEDATVVYDSLELASGETWKRAAHWFDRGLAMESDAIEIGASEASTEVRIAGVGDLAFTTARALHVGNAIDEDRFPKRLERFASRLVTGRAVERRALSTTSTGEWALHESVHFGAHATA